MANLGVNAAEKSVVNALITVDAQLEKLTSEIVSGKLTGGTISTGKQNLNSATIYTNWGVGVGKDLDANTAAGMFVVGQSTDKATRLGTILPKGEDAKDQIAKKFAQNM